MSINLRLGNNLEGNRPMRGTIRMFRAGERLLSSYEYDTLHDITGSDDGILPPPKHIVVDEAQRFFDRCGKGGHGAPPVTTDPRMTTGAALFAIMDDGDLRYWKRVPATEIKVDQGDFRSWGLNEDAVQDVGLSLQVRAKDGSSKPVYFDNASLKYSNILWEFSPDAGAGKWYQLYDLPNRAYTRVTLPDATNTLRARALSSNPDEWVQSFAITPKPDYQHGFVSDGGSMIVAPDEFWVRYDEVDGYVRWSDLVLEAGSPLYEVELDGEVIHRTRAPYARLGNVDMAQVLVYASMPGMERVLIGSPMASVTLRAVKLWDDDMNAAKSRPKRTTLRLYAGNEPTGDVFDMSASGRLPSERLPEFARIAGTDNWGYVSVSKPMYDQGGAEISYEFREDPVDGYSTTMDDSNEWGILAISTLQ